MEGEMYSEDLTEGKHLVRSYITTRWQTSHTIKL